MYSVYTHTTSPQFTFQIKHSLIYDLHTIMYIKYIYIHFLLKGIFGKQCGHKAPIPYRLISIHTRTVQQCGYKTRQPFL